MISMIFFVSIGICCALGATNCYGNVNNLRPSGKANGGVAGSHFDVDYRMRELNSMKTCYDQVASAYCIEASIIGAIASRESNGGASLLSSGLGSFDRNGYGIMQCDVRTSGMPCKRCGAWSCCHVHMMVRDKIVPDIKYMKTKFPTWSIERQVQAAIAAYNTGRSRVFGWDIDRFTFSRDYSSDVIARAQRLKNRHGWS